MWASISNNHAVVCKHEHLKFIYNHVHVLEVKNFGSLFVPWASLKLLTFSTKLLQIIKHFLHFFCFADSVWMDNFGRHCHCILTQLFLKLAKENVRSTNTRSLKICFSFNQSLLYPSYSPTYVTFINVSTQSIQLTIF